eukprot:1141516-Pelagomonas_calceolata.AAC.1
MEAQWNQTHGHNGTTLVIANFAAGTLIISTSRSQFLGKVLPVIPDLMALKKRVKRVDGRGYELSVYVNWGIDEGVFLIVERVHLRLGGPSADGSCIAGVIMYGSAAELCVGVWSICVGVMLSLQLERVLLLTGSSVDCASMAIGISCVSRQHKCAD